jgi:cobalt-zinc-cadmium efflux system outer membrane protein
MTQNIRKCLFATFLICSRALAGEPIAMIQAIALSQTKSPEIRGLQNQFESADAKMRMALAPSEPNLTVGFNDFLQPLNLNSVSSTVYQITQPLGFPGKAFLNRAALSDQAQAVQNQLRSVQLQVAYNVKQAYYNLGLAQKNLLLNADQNMAYEKILAVAKRRYEGGQTSQVDYINAQVALLNNQNDLIDLRSAEKVARAQLNVLIWNPPDTPIEVTPIEMTYPTAIDENEAISKMLANRPEVRAAQYQATASNKVVRLAWMSILPDFQLMVGTTNYNYGPASPVANLPDSPTRTYMASLQLTVPLWFLLNEREAIVGATHDRAVTEANLDGVYNQSKVALITTLSQISALESKIANYEKHLLPLSNQSFNLALTSYSSGKIDFQTLADTASARRTIRKDYAAAVVNFRLNYATYGQLIGEDL